MKELLTEYFGEIFEEGLMNEIADCGIIKKVKQDEALMNIGQRISHMPLLIDGVIKVSRMDESGEEMFLYFLSSGQTCAMTLNCCMGSADSEIIALADVDSTLILVPVEKLEEWMIKYKSWRVFVMNSYNFRMNEILNAVDHLAFKKLDERLWKYLFDKAKATSSNSINSTHQQIALDLNSSREVISRLLKQLENTGRIELMRNQIKIL